MSTSSSPAVPPPAAQQSPSRRSAGPWLLVLLVVLMPIAGVGAFYGYRQLRLRQAIADRGEIATVLDTYISRLKAKDAAGVQQLGSRSFEGLGAIQVAEGRIAKSHLYENYKSLVLNDVQVNSHHGSIFARVTGTIEYEDGTRRRLKSGLNRDGDTWLVNGFVIEDPSAEKDAAAL